jgi:hypothetical protein
MATNSKLSQSLKGNTNAAKDHSSSGYKYTVGGYFATKTKNSRLQLESKIASSSVSNNPIASIEDRKQMIVGMKKDTEKAIGDRSRTDVSPDFYSSLDSNLKSYPKMISELDSNIREHQAQQKKAQAAIKEANAYKPVSDAYLKNFVNQTKSDFSKKFKR